MGYTHNAALSHDDRSYYRARMLTDITKIVVGMTFVVVGVQFIVIPTAGFLLAGTVAGTGAYLFIRASTRRFEDFVEKRDLTHLN